MRKDSAARQTIPKEGMHHGWIQWKNTNVCMDIYCKCGYHSHIDSDFCYFVQCPKCKTIYRCNGHIELVELDENEAAEELGKPFPIVKTPEIDLHDEE